MAGIGFRLEQLLRGDSYRGLIQAYLYSALVSTGPWLLSILSLVLVGLLTSPSFLAAQKTLRLLRCVLVYSYAGTLVLTALVQMGTTRYIADRLYVNDQKALAPCFHFVAGLMLVLGTVVAGLFHAFAGLSFPAALAAVVLFQSLTLVWLGMIFLSAAKDYMAIVRAFLLGYALSLIAAVAGAWLTMPTLREAVRTDVIHMDNLAAMLWGFALGQVVLAMLLAIRIRVEFPSSRATDDVVRHHWRAMPHLVLVGFFFNLGIWADKVAFWAGRGETLVGWFRTAPEYDPAIFIGYLSIVPAMALFMIRIETAFYKHYAAFYTAITRGGDLAAIRREKTALMDALRLSALRLLKLQGTFTIAALLLANPFARWLGLDPELVPTLRVCFLAAFAQVMLLILLIFLLYFDWQREAAITSAIFLVLNAVFTVLTFGLPSSYYGFGYLAACLVALVAGLTVLQRRVECLEYETFTKQPMRA